MSVTAFQPIHQAGMFSTPKNSRPNSSLSCTTTASTTDSSENESQIDTKTPSRYENIYNNKHNQLVRSKRIGENGQYNPNHSRGKNNSPTSLAERVAENKRILLRRSSSGLRVREMREVLAKMTEENEGENDEKEARVTGSQKARLLVASQQCLVSRLQDLRHEMESMDNEVSRVRNDIINSRRYFSAMMGVPCGPEWSTTRQNDSAYTSPTSFISNKSTDISPYSSDNDYPLPPPPPQSSSSSSSSSSSYYSSSYHKSSTNSTANNEAFQQLQQFKDQQQQHFSRSRVNGGRLSRSDSCSSFTSWRSEVEMASLFPEDYNNNNRSTSVSPQVTPRTVRQRISPSAKDE